MSEVEVMDLDTEVEMAAREDEEVLLPPPPEVGAQDEGDE